MYSSRSASCTPDSSVLFNLEAVVGAVVPVTCMRDVLRLEAPPDVAGRGAAP